MGGRRSALERLSRLFVEPAAAVEPPAAEPPTERVAFAPERVRVSAAPSSDWLPPVAEPRLPAPERVLPPRSSAVAVLCGERDARVAGGAAALALCVGTAAPVVVAEWGSARGDAPPPDRSASRPVRQLAAALRDRDVRAHAVGRFARALLAPEAEVAAGEWAAVCAAAPGPVVLVVVAPRVPAIERLIADCDLALLANRPDADAELTSLAAEELRRGGLRVELVCCGAPAAISGMAVRGIRLAPPLRAPFLAALGTG